MTPAPPPSTPDMPDDITKDANEMLDLLPCPFCGGKEVQSGYRRQGDVFWFQCWAGNCSAKGSNAKTLEGAANNWNTRTPETVDQPSETTENLKLEIIREVMRREDQEVGGSEMSAGDIIDLCFEMMQHVDQPSDESRARMNEGVSCPTCGALPCDQVNSFSPNLEKHDVEDLIKDYSDYRSKKYCLAPVCDSHAKLLRDFAEYIVPSLAALTAQKPAAAVDLGKLRNEIADAVLNLPNAELKKLYVGAGWINYIIDYLAAHYTITEKTRVAT